MSQITCRYCDAEFTPTLNKPGYYDVCHRCTEIELAERPDLEPEPLVAGPSIDESGTFEEIGPKHAMPKSCHPGGWCMADTMTQREDRAASPRQSARRH